MIDNNKIKISKMTIIDFEDIKSILVTEFDDFWNENLLESELQNENSYYLVAKYDNEIIGFAGIKSIFDEADVMNIVVKKKYRKLGIGSFLFKKIIDYAKSNGIKKLTLEVNENNVSAIHLYEKFGFKQIARRNRYYNGVSDALIMQLYLK